MLVVLVALVAGLLALTGRFHTPPTGGLERTDCVVTHVYDGDTVQVDDYRKVRLIGIDALDAHNEEKRRRQAAELGLSESAVTRWAERAAERARELLAGRRVRLELARPRRDEYGRTLAYLHLRSDGEDVLFNALLLREGLAVAYRKFAHPRREEFLALEEKARAERLGLWREVPRAP